MRSLAALLLVLCLALPALAAKPKAGDVLADPEIKAPLKPEEAAALGIPAGAKSFRLSQVKAELVLVEIFSMYCPRCQAEAPAVNRLQEKLKASPRGRGIVFLGVGAGNSSFEVDVFRKKFHIAMPLIPDGDYVLHKVFGAVGTPSYFLLRPMPGGKGLAVLFFQEGQFEDEDPFLERILSAAGL